MNEVTERMFCVAMIKTLDVDGINKVTSEYIRLRDDKYYRTRIFVALNMDLSLFEPKPTTQEESS